MKNIYSAVLCCLLLSVSLYTQAQTTLTSGSRPLIGQEFFLTSVSGSSYDINQGLSGNNVWDFSDLPTANTQEALFLAIENTPHAPIYEDIADYAILYKDSLQFGSSPLKYEFFKMSGESLLKIGDANIAGVVSPLTDGMDLMRFPFTFGDSYTDEFAGSYFVGQTEVIRSGTVSVRADGYGNLQLPYGEIENVLRVKTTISLTDAVPGTEFNLEIELYTWYHANLAYPILQILYEGSEGVSTIVTNLTYIEHPDIPIKQAIGIPLAESIALRTYPNPATDWVQIDYTLPKSANVLANIYYMNGQIAQQLPNTYQLAGQQQMALAIKDLPKGMYLLELMIDKEQVIRKLIVE